MNRTKALNPNKQHFLQSFHRRGGVLTPIVSLLLKTHSGAVLRAAKASDKVTFKSSMVSGHFPLVKYWFLFFFFNCYKFDSR